MEEPSHLPSLPLWCALRSLGKDEVERRVQGVIVEQARVAEVARLAEVARVAEVSRVAEVARVVEVARVAEVARVVAEGWEMRRKLVAGLSTIPGIMVLDPSEEGMDTTAPSPPISLAYVPPTPEHHTSVHSWVVQQCKVPGRTSLFSPFHNIIL